jgi:glycosyltransferase involved in cell wall biosynthesis
MVGNDYLCAWAANYGLRVVTFPTVVDTDRYTPSDGKSDGKLTVGWCGSHSTNMYVNMALPALEELAGRYPVKLRVISDTPDGIDFSACKKLQTEFSQWDADTEVKELQSLTIGIMPLPLNEWTRGKCALKALLYMACGVPAVCSPVGPAKRLIRNGHNGFLAASGDEWRRKLESLLNNGGLRRKFAEEGRKTVVEKFSLNRQAAEFLDILTRLCGAAKGAGGTGKNNQLSF